MKSTNDRIAITENTLSDNSAPTSDQPEKESHLEVVSVMMTDITAEAVMVRWRELNLLMKSIKERDHEIVVLRDQIKAHFVET